MWCFKREKSARKKNGSKSEIQGEQLRFMSAPKSRVIFTAFSLLYFCFFSPSQAFVQDQTALSYFIISCVLGHLKTCEAVN